MHAHEVCGQGSFRGETGKVHQNGFLKPAATRWLLGSLAIEATTRPAGARRRREALA